MELCFAQKRQAIKESEIFAALSLASLHETKKLHGIITFEEGSADRWTPHKERSMEVQRPVT